MGVLSRDERSSVDRHLERCAACRKESGELQRATATLAFSVAPIEPPAGLENRVVDAIRSAVERRGVRAPRRRAAWVVLAAVLTLTTFGWGVVMATRSGDLEERVRLAIAQRQNANKNYAELIRELEGADPANVVELADLMSPRQRIGGGDALVLLSPSFDDVVLVAFTGLSDLSTRRLPLEVWLESDDVPDVMVGTVGTLDTDGGGGVSKWFVESLRPFDAIVVRDARGRVLLNGTLTVYESTA
jgi:hypothetical protein